MELKQSVFWWNRRKDKWGWSLFISEHIEQKMADTKVMQFSIYKASFMLFTLIIKGKNIITTQKAKLFKLQVGNPCSLCAAAVFSCFNPEHQVSVL